MTMKLDVQTSLSRPAERQRRCDNVDATTPQVYYSWVIIVLMSDAFISALRKKCPNTEVFMVRTFPHLDWIRRFTKSPYSVWIWEITDQKKLHIWTLFIQCRDELPFSQFLVTEAKQVHLVLLIRAERSDPVLIYTAQNISMKDSFSKCDQFRMYESKLPNREIVDQEIRWDGLEICHVFVDSIVFRQ